MMRESVPSQAMRKGTQKPAYSAKDSATPDSSLKSIAPCEGLQVPSRAAGEIVIVLPLPPKECHQNNSGRTGGWRERAAAVRKAREFAYFAMVNQPGYATGPRWERCIVSLYFRFPDRRRRDIFNYAGAAKPFLDGLVDAGVMADDSGIEWGEIGREIDKANPGVTITIRPVESEGE